MMTCRGKGTALSNRSRAAPAAFFVPVAVPVLAFSRMGAGVAIHVTQTEFAFAPIGYVFVERCRGHRAFARWHGLPAKPANLFLTNHRHIIILNFSNF